MKAFKTIEEYIAAQDEGVKPVLENLRNIIRSAAPDAMEKISYGMPSFYLNGNLVYFAAWKNHIGFYATPSGNDAFKEALSGYKTSKGAVQFPLSQPLPEALIVKMVQFRVQQNLVGANSKKIN